MLALCGVTAFLLRGYCDTYTIEMSSFRIQHPALGEVLSGVTVAFVSDLHAQRLGPREEKILEILQEVKPDLLLLGGDYISFRGAYEPALSFFQQCKKAYGVLGNTEYSNENGSCILCHEKKSTVLKMSSTPVLLRNSAVILEFQGKKINLVGLDDPVHKKEDLKAALQHIDRSAPIILLAHSPQVFEEISGAGIDFILCGHNHGGQIFLTKYLRRVLPMEPVLEFLDGFYQRGKTLMYVSRGVGTSFLPFRLGIKPEVTLFRFAAPEESLAARSFRVTDQGTRAFFAGLSLSSLLEFHQASSSRSPESRGLHPARGASSLSSAEKVLFDFEAEAELDHLDWECHKWFEQSSEHATSGKYSLKAVLPAGPYPGIHFQGIDPNWSKYKALHMDVYNPAQETVRFHIRIDDAHSAWGYADRFDRNFALRTGGNAISIPLSSLKTNINPRPLDLHKIERLMIFLPANQKTTELFIDNIRLE